MALRRWLPVLAAAVCGALGQGIAAWGTSTPSFLAALALFALGGWALARVHAPQPMPPNAAPGPVIWRGGSLALVAAALLFDAIATGHTEERFSGLQIAIYIASMVLLLTAAWVADRKMGVGGRGSGAGGRRTPEPTPDPRSPTPIFDWLALTFLTLLAIGLRLWHLGSQPPLIWDDEVLYLFDALRLVEEELVSPFASGNWGAPYLHAYSIAASFTLIADRVAALRLVSALPGALTVPLLYLAMRELLDRRVAFFAAFLMAVATWHVILSRQGYVWAINGFAESIVLLFLARGLRRGRALHFALAGFGLGLGFFYSYAAALMPLVLVLFTLYLLLFDRRLLVARFAGLVFLGVCAAASVAPRLGALLANPDMRGYQMGALVTREDVGSPAEILAGQALQIAQSFNRRADNNEMFVPGPNEPLLDPVTAAAFGLGVFWALFSPGQRGAVLLLLTFAVMLVPSAIGLSSTDWATAWRACGVVPALFGLAGVPFAAAGAAASGSLGRWAAGVLAAVLLLFVGGVNTHSYFVRHVNKPHWFSGHNASHGEAARRLLEAPSATRVLVNHDLATGQLRGLASGRRPYEVLTWPDDATLPDLLGDQPRDSLVLSAAQLYWEDDVAAGAVLVDLLAHYYPGGRRELVVGSDGHALLAAFAASAAEIRAAHGLEEMGGRAVGTLSVPRDGVCRFDRGGLTIDGEPFDGALLLRGLHQIAIEGSGTGLAWSCDGGEMQTVPENLLLRRLLPPWGLRERLWRGETIAAERWVPLVWFAAERLAEIPPELTIEWSGEARIASEGTYTLMMMTSARSSIWIDGEPIVRDALPWPEWLRRPVELSEGWHPLRVVAGPPVKKRDLRLFWIDARLQPGLFGGVDSRPTPEF